MRPFVPWTAFFLPISFVCVGAAAQSQPTAAASSGSSPSSAPANGQDADTAPGASAAPSKPTFPATGYSYGGPSSSTPPPPTAPAHGERTPRPPRANLQGADAIMAGFETLPSGATRLFVQLSKAASYDTKATGSTLTFVLKGTRIERRNNENPLVTVHFNTPVTSARLVPRGRDLWFVLDLRANVQPVATMDGAKDGAAVLRVDFPKGDYLPAGAQPSPDAAAPASSSSKSPPAGGAPAAHVASTVARSDPPTAN